MERGISNDRLSLLDNFCQEYDIKDHQTEKKEILH